MTTSEIRKQAEWNEAFDRALAACLKGRRYDIVFPTKETAETWAERVKEGSGRLIEMREVDNGWRVVWEK